jgi:Na+/melibiose symporter-like transporter
MFAKGAWIFAMYTMVMAVFETFLSANGPVYMARVFKNHEQHVALQTYGSIIVMFGVALFNVTFPMAMNRIATSPQGWTRLLLLFGVPLCAIGFLRFFLIKEVTDSDVRAAEKVNLKELITVLKSNKYIWFIAVWFFTYNVVTNITGTINQYYYQHIVRNMDLFGVASLGTIVILPIFFAMPALLRRVATGRVIVYGLLICALGYLLNYFAYTNFALLMIGSILTGVGAVPANMFLPLVILDNAEYNEFLGHERLEGSISALTGFTQNVGAAAGAFIIGILLTSSGYAGAAEIQSGSALSMIRHAFSLIPMAILTAVAIIMLFYNLDAKIPKIRETNLANRKGA